MRYIIFILATVAIFLACNTGDTIKGAISTANLEAKQFTINIDRDTTIQTKNGAVLKIPKGALATDKGNTVTLEIKEAYSIQQMIEAGLTTQSNGEPLSSGGMIYIGAAAGQNVTIKQKLQVAIPASPLDREMKLFKGQEDANGNINWTDPIALPENKQAAVIDTGRILFESHCANCHSIGKDMTGPNLAHFMKRFAPVTENDKYYVAHLFPEDTFLEKPFPDEMQRIDSVAIAKPDTTGHSDEYYHYRERELYRCNLIRRYGSRGTYFPDLPKQSILSIYRYIQNESDRLALPIPSNELKDCVDSCAKYNERKYKLDKARKKAIKENGDRVNLEMSFPPVPDDTTTSVQPVPSIPARPFEDVVSPENYESVYYQFTVETFGWFNLDILLKEKQGVKESELFVWIRGEYREKVQVFLIVPSEKAFVQGGVAGEADKYAFWKKNGKIPLPQNQKSYILALIETESSIAYAIREFTITPSQTFELSLTASTKEKFNSAIRMIGFDSLSIKVEDSKNATEIRNLGEQIKENEKLKPKGCDCDCSPGLYASGNGLYSK
jgi:hypothetical protein